MSTAPPHNPPDGQLQETNHSQVALARQAASGDTAARKRINRLIHPIITYQTNRFCRRFCQGNRHRYACTLQPPPAWRAPKQALLCEFGNASYAWMLDDLTRKKRLSRFEGRHGARLYDYLYRIANSLPFYERWKDWRFGRKVHVPTYIREMGPLSARVFLELRAHSGIAEIAHKLNQSEADTEALCHAIVATLTQRNRLHLLDPPRTVSLSEPEWSNHDGQAHREREREIEYVDDPPEEREAKQKLNRAWQQLTAVEQFVLEAMLIDDEDADDVLQALQKLGISIKKGVAPEKCNRQQLYYFRRKAFQRLRELMHSA